MRHTGFHRHRSMSDQRAIIGEYTSELRHWSYGDRSWGLLTGAGHAIHGPVQAGVAA
jgi:hypothetical protein